MAYGSALVDTIQSSTVGTPVQFNDGGGTQVGKLCRAWVNFVGTSGSINTSFNVSSVTRNSTGNYTVTFTNAMADSYFAASFSAYSSGTTQGRAFMVNAISASAFTFIVTVPSSGSATDETNTMATIFR